MGELKRRKIVVPAPGGNQWSQDANGWKGMDEYVHLCFRSNHPMEYLARKEGRIQDAIYLHIHPDVMYWEGVRFTADVANKSGIEVHTIVPKVITLDLIRNLPDG